MPVQGQAAAGSAEPRETSGVTTRLILAYVHEEGGEDAVRAVLRRAGQTRRGEALSDEATWSSYDTKIRLFEAAADVLGDPGVARRIGASLIAHRGAAPLHILLSALGTPQLAIRSVARASGKFSTVATMRAVEVEAGRAVVTYRLHEPHAPSPHDCGYTIGLLTQLPVVFSLPPAIVRHEGCQVHGAPECRYELSWRRRPPSLRWLRPVATGSPDGATLRQQLEDLQRAGIELVTTRDLDRLLERIAARASSAVRAQRFVLAVHLDEGDEPRIHSDGLAPSAAAEAGRALLAGEQADEQERLIADVYSGRHRYGRLAAYLPAGHGFLPGEQELLDAYAALAAAALDTATALEAARRRGERSEALLALARHLIGVSSEGDVATAVAAAVPPVLGAMSGALLLWRPAEQALVTAATAGFPPDLAEAAASYRVDLGATPALSAMLAAHQPVVYTADDPDPFVRQSVRAFSSALVGVAPIVVRGEFLGTVHGQWPLGAALPNAHEDLLRGLSSLADQAGLALANLRMLADVRHRATHDPLTDLANRALFTELLADALARGARDGTVTAVCFLDLDGFKAVNDTYGHAAGDAVLLEVAARLRRTVRESDTVARLSGDEFGVLLHGARAGGDAAVVADKIVSALAEPFRMERRREVRLGASVGVALGPEHGDDPEQLLARADAAMYDAKRVGSTARLYRLSA